MYVVVRTKERGRFFQRLHALDVTTGSEKFGGPVVIQARVKGSGDGSVDGFVYFDPLRNNQRSGLLLANGFASQQRAEIAGDNPAAGRKSAIGMSIEVIVREHLLGLEMRGGFRR